MVLPKLKSYLSRDPDHKSGFSNGRIAMPSKRDIVYILRPDIDPSELIYSLRSIEKNFPHRKVWFVCGQPKRLEPDGRIEHTQTGESKWDKIKSSIVKVYDKTSVPENPDFLSTDDGTFNDGAVGEYIRSKFSKPSRFEVDLCRE